MSARKIVFGFLIIALSFLFLITSPVKASFSLRIESINPTSVSSKSNEVEVVLSITDLPWVKIKSLSDDCSDYYYVTDTNITGLTLVTKIGEDEELDSGIYLIRAHRFTLGCSLTPSLQNPQNNFIIISLK